MPFINKIQRKPKTAHTETPMRELRQKAYSQTAWKKLRETYIKEHALCEECLKEGRITAAEDVHHRISPFKNGEVNQTLLLDYANLESLCKIHHQQIHNGGIKQTPQQIIEMLDALLDENISDEDIEKL